MKESNYKILRGCSDSPVYSDVETCEGEPRHDDCDNQLCVLLVNLVVHQTVGQLGIEDTICRDLHELGDIVRGTNKI